MPLRTVSPKVTFGNVVRDFDAAWNGIAVSASPDIGRGNFLFGLFGTVLLEWACRVCRQDPSRQSLDRLSRSLYQIEPRYFTPLPSHCKVRRPGDFDLPAIFGQRSTPLLWALFDLCPQWPSAPVPTDPSAPGRRLLPVDLDKRRRGRKDLGGCTGTASFRPPCLLPLSRWKRRRQVTRGSILPGHPLRDRDLGLA